jgi:RNA polymerase-binding transcription factor DksA
VAFPTSYLLALAIFLIALFLIWFDGYRDGFEREHLLDLVFLSSIWIGLAYFVINYYAYLNAFLNRNQLLTTLYVAVLGVLFLVKLAARRWRWSVYHLLDIFTIYFLMFFFFVFGREIINQHHYMKLTYLALLLVVYLMFYLNKQRLFSGFLFSVFFLLIAIFGQIFYRTEGYLIFYFLLITISMLNLFFRNRRNSMMRKLGSDFIEKIKELLKLKEKRLESEQQRLIEEDPYLQEGRDVGNSEEIDEAILEDRAKVESDIKQENLQDMRQQVDKALDKIEKGNYGYCEVCGKPIDKARLKAYPEATTCVEHSS